MLARCKALSAVAQTLENCLMVSSEWPADSHVVSLKVTSEPGRQQAGGRGEARYYRDCRYIFSDALREQNIPVGTFPA